MSSNQPIVYVSYRREDSVAYVGRIYDRLRQAFGQDNVITSQQTIDTNLDTQLDEVDVMLVIIGQMWEIATDNDGQRYLDKPDDFVRREVETALNKPYVAVISVLVAKTTMPNRLPNTINAMGELQAYNLRGNPDFHDDMDILVREMREQIAIMRSETQTESYTYNATFFYELLEIDPETVEANRQGILTETQQTSVTQRSVGCGVIMLFISAIMIFCIVVIFPSSANTDNTYAIVGYVIIGAILIVPLLIVGTLLAIRSLRRNKIQYENELEIMNIIDKHTGTFEGVHKVGENHIHFYIGDKFFSQRLKDQNAAFVEKHLRHFEGYNATLYSRRLGNKQLSIDISLPENRKK